MLVFSVVFAACSGKSDGPVLTVLAASSLGDAFLQMERAFEEAHPGVDVVVSTAGSQALRVQIEQGAGADVFASADARQAEALVALGFIHLAHVFAQNRFVVALPEDNPADVASLFELPQASRIVLGTPESPIGRYSQEILDRASKEVIGFRSQVEERVVSYESNVRIVLAKVELGEADAAIVYATDVLAGGGRRVSTVRLPPRLTPSATYHVGVLVEARELDLAKAWVAFILSAEGQDIMSASGFLEASS